VTRRGLVGLCAALLALAGAAAGADERADEKADAKAERARIEAAFKADLAACEARFVVTACVDDAKQRRRNALAPVRLRELQLDALERQRRASERLAQTQRKQE
jgi:colicin import membrane protein